MESIYIKWPITSDCKLDCIFCNNKEDRKHWPTELNNNEIISFISFINNNNNISGLTISGGEPLCHPNFIDTCNQLTKDFGFITSGLNLSSDRFRTIFLNDKLKFITLSIDCLDRDIVKKIRGRDILDEQLVTLKYLLDYKEKNPNFKIFINTVATKLNINYIKKLVIEMSKLNVDRIQVFKFYPTGSPDIDLSLSISKFEKFRLAEDLIELYIKNKDIWSEKNFELDIRFLSASDGLHFNNKFRENLPIRPKGCGIHRNTIYLKSDTRMNLCRAYNFTHKTEEIKNLKIYELDLNKVLTNIILKCKDKVLNRENYSQFKPCFECNQLLKSCHPCVELSKDNNVLVNIKACEKYSDILKICED